MRPKAGETALNRTKRFQSHLEDGAEEPEFKADCPLEQYQAGSTLGFELFRPSLVPLAPQALAYLTELRPLTGHGRYVFPSLRTGERPMSDNTINAALRRMGFSQDEMSAHGFRATARTLMIERMPGISADVIEAQLAHGKSGPLGMAYDRAEFMEQRRKMMIEWADYLDELRIGAEVIQFRAA